MRSWSEINQEFWAIYLRGTELVINREYHKIMAHFFDDLPNECVGLVWNDGHIQRLRNQANSPKRFSISKPQLAEKLTEREEQDGIFLMAIYHSHPGGSPQLSGPDKKSFRAQHESGLRIPWLVVTEKKARLWFMDKKNGEETGMIGSFLFEPTLAEMD